MDKNKMDMDMDKRTNNTGFRSPRTFYYILRNILLMIISQSFYILFNLVCGWAEVRMRLERIILAVFVLSLVLYSLY
ncbi:hypothetical protein QBC47DRAFT_393737 [Echria macrotheca]|uniref:Uncharacterized protein n=1 Tax=Echria macrotheca TaxID=438768 RepID=A0AAJ0F0X0_9PEZI|nr:hypothetical protein QBC47DRAFT_393737 [Echria macrotheca]